MAKLFVEYYSNTEFWQKANITSEDYIFPIDGFTDQWLENLLNRNENPAALITEYSYYRHSNFDLRVIGLPLWLDHQIKELSEFDQSDPDMVTDINFNFMCKKKRLSRFLLCKCVELYKLNNYDYTWSGDDRNEDLSGILSEIWNSAHLTSEQKGFMLSGISMPAKLIEPDFVEDHCAIFNLKLWQSKLKEIFSKSAVSLITETIEDAQKVSMFTEKTLFSVLGFTFPIWPGSYAQADLWKDMGFDPFDDIIDHSYQFEESILDRVVRAVKDNLEILRDIDLARRLREQSQERFKKNKDLILSGQVSKFMDQKISTLSVLDQKACGLMRLVYTTKIKGVHDLT